MCNDYRLMVELASVIEEFEHLKIKIRFPEGRPNIEAREDIRITNTAPSARGSRDSLSSGDAVEMRTLAAALSEPSRRSLLNCNLRPCWNASE